MENIYGERYFVGVKFDTGGKSYYFSTDYEDLHVGDLVVAETVNGEEIGMVSTQLFKMENYHSDKELKPILRKPTKADISDYEESIAKAKKALEIAEREVKKLDLPMRLFEASYSLDGDRCTIFFFSEQRVDFRELLKILAPMLHCRIELRQIPPRDKAKMVGGIGICGLPLCCSSFLKEFDGISISRANNQMLSLNIPKLSGQCGKLICCLLYEDDAYTEAKKMFPSIGSRVKMLESEYSVASYNVLSKTVTLKSDASLVTITLDEYKDYARGVTPKKTQSELPKSAFKVSGGIPESQLISDMDISEMERRQNNQNQQGNKNNQQGNKNKHNQQHNQNRSNNQNRNPNQQPQQQGQGGGKNRHRNRHRHHRPNNNQNNNQGGGK